MELILTLIGIIFLFIGLWIHILQYKKIYLLYTQESSSHLKIIIRSFPLIFLLLCFFIIGYVLEFLYAINWLIFPVYEYIRNHFIIYILFGGSIFVVIINIFFYNFLIRLLAISFSKEYIETIYNNIDNYIIITDPKFYITDINHFFLNQFEVAKKSIIGKNISEILSIENSHIQAGKSFHFICNFNQKEKYVYCSISKLKVFGKLKGYLFSANDITEITKLKNQIEQERNLLKRFFSPKIIEDIFHSMENNHPDFDSSWQKLKGNVTKGIIIFVDIRNSTQMSLEIEPMEFTRILNHFIEKICKKVFSCGGTVNKLLGDGILITFPHQELDRALLCIQNILQLNHHQQKNSRKLEFGISCHYGNFFSGIIGNQYLYDYTILGESINLTVKIQNINKKLQLPVIITQEVISQIPLEKQKKFPIISIGKIYWRYIKKHLTLYTMQI